MGSKDSCDSSEIPDSGSGGLSDVPTSSKAFEMLQWLQVNDPSSDPFYAHVRGERYPGKFKNAGEEEVIDMTDGIPHRSLMR